MEVSIVGLGTVGQSLHRLFPAARLHDPAKGHHDIVRGIAFVCVPTPMGAGGACDTSIVRSVVNHHDADLFVIRSTVPPGTCRTLGKPVVFQPEFLGMTPGHRYASDADVPFVILGGARSHEVADLYRSVLPPDTAYRHTSLEAAELVKYAVNAFLATKVEFANELYDACSATGVEYDELRELWLLDDRVGRSHTAVNPHDRPFGGACFPKDIAALVAWADASGLDLPVVRAAAEANADR